MPLRRIVAGGCAAVMVGVTALSGCAGRPAPVAAQGPLAVELNTLVSQRDGLYFPPYLLDEPAGPEDNAFAVLTAEELRRPSTVRLTAAEMAKLREDALANSGLYGRWWLSVIGEHAGHGLLTDADFRAIDALRAPGGWYADTDADNGGAAASVTDRLAATEAALSILTRRNSDIPGATADSQLARRHVCRAHRGGGRRELCVRVRAPRPAGTRREHAGPTGGRPRGGGRSGQVRGSRRHLLLRHLGAGRPATRYSSSATTGRRCCRTMRGSLDYAGLYLAVTVAVAADVDPGTLAAVEERLTAAQPAERVGPRRRLLRRQRDRHPRRAAVAAHLRGIDRRAR